MPLAANSALQQLSYSMSIAFGSGDTQDSAHTRMLRNLLLPGWGSLAGEERVLLHTHPPKFLMPQLHACDQLGS